MPAHHDAELDGEGAAVATSVPLTVPLGEVTGVGTAGLKVVGADGPGVEIIGRSTEPDILSRDPELGVHFSVGR